MNKLLALLLCLALPVYVSAQTDPIANMRGWCDCVMTGGVCRVTNGPAAKPGSRTFLSSGVVPSEVYNQFKNDPLMCQRGEQSCRADWTGQGCVFFRGAFRQTPMTCERIGEPVERK